MTTPPDDELWSAIADPSRRRVLDLLISNGAASASWLARQVPFSRQAVSKHLVVLEGAGLVRRRKQGREVLYQVQAGRLDQATRAMADLAAQWDRRLTVIKRLAEALHAEQRGSEVPHPDGDDHDGRNSPPGHSPGPGAEPAPDRRPGCLPG